MTLSSPATTEQDDTHQPIRVMIVDDSVVIRGWIRRTLDAHGEFKIVATASNGQIAVNTLQKLPVDVIVLDIEMPVMDGLTAIPLLKAIDAGVQIIMASTLTLKNAEISLKAMALGATDYIPKPVAVKEADLGGSDGFARELIEKVRTLGGLARRRGVRPAVGVTTMRPLVTARPVHAPTEKKKIVLRPMPRQRPDIIAIGSSTGGPQALFDVIKAMGSALSQPIVITQHMPASFTSILAEHITHQSNVTCVEAKDNDVLKPGHYYVAPGDFHMQFMRRGDGIAVKLTKEPLENFCRPSVDPMLRSLVEIYHDKILAVILTGMGQDGLKGGRAVIDAGGGMIAQDEATSVVWGMPGAVALAGLCSAVLPLQEIGASIRKVTAGNGL